MGSAVLDSPMMDGYPENSLDGHFDEFCLAALLKKTAVVLQLKHSDVCSATDTSLAYIKDVHIDQILESLQ